MEAAPVIWDASKSLCRSTAKHTAFMCCLEDNLGSLRGQWAELRSLSQDVNARIQEAESLAHMRRTREVDGWLQSVNALEQVTEDIMQRAAKVIQFKCLGRLCPKNCFSSYFTGKEVVKTLDRARELTARGQKFNNDANIAYQLPCEPVNEMPVATTVGMDSMLKKVWDSIEDENVSVIGLYGMGGSGKTTLMRKLNNELANRSHDFALAIWLVVSKDCNIDQIMEDIRQKCGIDDMKWKNKSKDEKAIEIYRVMKQKKFILLLDDIWEEPDLQSIGVPLPKEVNQSKILFTTRLENVCDQMQAKKFKVECLTEKEALDLFFMKVGAETLNSHPSINGLSQELVQECKGLPLALITVGRAMAGRKSPQAWKHAIRELQSFPSGVSGMEKVVFNTLKFSYDSLPTDIDKKCFLYCALFPEDRTVYVPRLIRLWIGEGFLKEHGSIHDAYNHGEDIVERLKLACLLEGEEFLWVKMHDVVRDMALWIARNQDQEKNKVLVQGEAIASSQIGNPERSLMIERISMMYTKRDDWCVPKCPNLLTLIVWGNDSKIDFANVRFLSNLKVLSLRMEMISTIPTEIGQLIYLEYLELSEMHIKEKLPLQMKNLKSLRVFLLEYVHFSLEIIPLEVISNLEGLRVFSFIESRFKEKIKSSFLAAIDFTHNMEKSFLEQLELLPFLEDLSITLETATGIKKLLSSTKLKPCVRLMGLYQYKMAASTAPLLPSVTSMQHLERMTLVGLQDNMTESSVNHSSPFCKLRWVTILDCHDMTHLTWLKYALVLDYLIVENCNLMEEVIKEAQDDQGNRNMDDLFSNLRYISLRNLPMLKSIYKKALPFPMLQYINIMECPNLKKLPLDSNSARNKLRAIWGEKLWWDNLEWDDQTIKGQFCSKFKD
ncbi:probable disease resistance protein At1g61300 [Neltuma alba]|uniref:probable disease resistance protein At1g61300 n=1 Tax=Neltuma alba TaxID=207710 RepID=UPI0010A35A91|nr:probable disease resistance protein At1g61300 [Prosopis alba]XP_028756789.1 probable disease resistance protein At1g61300 [Prosopis alba]XP_028756790.1 probable disease resistance protein At1g61300 [Prosopis alba]XP_028788604.1 probable disease resistance protein At1g61300 [Prosopis alba]XP_028788605.1 probable disease resistance protein At1g61300 [Prosopis alba]